MNINFLSPDKEKKWDEFVIAHPKASVFHLTGFKKVIEELFGYRAFYFYLEENEDIKMILPTFLVSGLFSPRRRLLSVPCFECGGILSVYSEPAAYKTFIQFILDIMKKEKIDYTEIHYPLGQDDTILNSYFIKTIYSKYAVLKLETPDYMFKKKIDYQVRKAINKAIRNGLEVFEDKNLNIYSSNFFPMYLSWMKYRHGTPPFPKKFWVLCQKYLSNFLKGFYVTYKQEIIAYLLGFVIGHRIYIANIVSPQKYWNLRPNDLVHWAFIKWGAENDYHYFDFGSARYEGQIYYKKKWGCDFYDYEIHYLGVSQNFRKPKVRTPEDFKYKLLAWVWKQLIPLSITPYLGGFIRKHLVY